MEYMLLARAQECMMNTTCYNAFERSQLYVISVTSVIAVIFVISVISGRSVSYLSLFRADIKYDNYDADFERPRTVSYLSFF